MKKNSDNILQNFHEFSLDLKDIPFETLLHFLPEEEGLNRSYSEMEALVWMITNAKFCTDAGLLSLCYNDSPACVVCSYKDLEKKFKWRWERVVSFIAKLQRYGLAKKHTYNRKKFVIEFTCVKTQILNINIQPILKNNMSELPSLFSEQDLMDANNNKDKPFFELVFLEILNKMITSIFDDKMLGIFNNKIAAIYHSCDNNKYEFIKRLQPLTKQIQSVEQFKKFKHHVDEFFIQLSKSI